MKKSDYSEVLSQIEDKTEYIDTELNNEMKKSFIAYAMAVNVSRAIPDVRDGLKPVHRRIIYGMGEMGLTSDKPYKKSARIVGDVMGKYHPHGDSSIYDAMVRLAQDFNINCPLVDGHGNFGSVDGDPAAASRYTEARMSKVTAEMLRDINKNTVDFVPNYDGEEVEPTVLPSRFPNILVNGSDGIAVGMATNIPPHNLKEVCNGAIAMLDNPDITVDELIDIIPAPDFPTKALIMGTTSIQHAYRTGRGGIIMRARCEITEIKDRQAIVVTELPYQVNKSKLIMAIADLVKERRIEGIANVKDESDRKGLRIVIDIKKDANAQVVLNYLYKHTQLQLSDGMIFLALANGEPKTLNLREILYYYLEHQKEVVTRRTKFDLEKAQERAHILEGLEIALNNIDEAIAIIKASSDKATAVSKLTQRFGLDEPQANAILDMRLQRLTGLEIEKIKQELNDLHIAIEDYKDILAKPHRVSEIIKQELTEIRDKYGVDRKTEIIPDYSNINIEDLIEKEDVVISLSKGGYVKRLPLKEYRSQRRGGKGSIGAKIKQEDVIDKITICSTHDDLLVLTTFGRCYGIKGYEVPEAGKTAQGRNMINVVPLMPSEKVCEIIPVIGTEQGIIKKTKMEEYSRINKNGKIAIRLKEGDSVLCAHYLTGTEDILVAASNGKCARFNSELVREVGRDSIGVKAMELAEGATMVDLIVIDETKQLLTITEFGYGKRTEISEYPAHQRGTKGVKAGEFNLKTGKLVCLKQVDENDDVLVISNNGTIIRTAVSSVRVLSRTAMGVTLMKLDKNSKVASVAITEKEEDLPEEELDENGNLTQMQENLTENTTAETENTEVNNENFDTLNYDNFNNSTDLMNEEDDI